MDLCHRSRKGIAAAASKLTPVSQKFVVACKDVCLNTAGARAAGIGAEDSQASQDY